PLLPQLPTQNLCRGVHSRCRLAYNLSIGLEQMLALHPTPIGRPRFFSQPAPYRFSIHIEPPRNRRDRLARLPQAPDLVPALLTDHPLLLQTRSLEVDRLLNRHGPSCQADRRWGIFDDRAWGLLRDR